jgi:hypothetical protein
MSAANVLMCDGLRACRQAQIIMTVDGERLCSGCHRRRETPRRKPRRKSVRQVASAPRRQHAVLDPVVTDSNGDPYIPCPRRSRQDSDRRLGGDAVLVPDAPVGVRLGTDHRDRPHDVRPEVETRPCTTCDRGKISQARWDEGKRQCTTCAPLNLVAVGVHKSIPTILLAEDVTPENVAQGRRRP